MENLKKLLTLKPSEDKVNTAEGFDGRFTYHNQGFGKSKACQGNSHNLKVALDSLFYKFEKECKESEIEQQRLKQPYITERKAKQTNLINEAENLGKAEQQKSDLESNIEKLRQTKIDVKNNPSDFGIEVEKKSSAKFWIGLTFILPLTVYIFIFYISTSYSAFFRTFNPETDLFGGLFYPQALTEAYRDGILELGFILFIPFVFFALGYLIHMFQHKKGIINTFKIVLLFIVTFIFDAILAYQIDSKLYSLNKTFEDPEFNIPLAFQSPGFWVIIFAGFVSYVVWGLVFDFIMKEHSDRDQIKMKIASIDHEIKNKIKVLEKIEEKIITLDKSINDLKVKISELDSIVDGFIFPAKNYKNISSSYFDGWQHYTASELPLGPKQKDELLQRCQDSYDSHLESKELLNFDNQNRIFKKTS